MIDLLGTQNNYSFSTNYLKLPSNVRARVRALKNIQLESVKIEKKYFDEVHALECKFEKLFQPLMKKRFEIVNGLYEPTEEETEFKEDLDDRSVNKKVDPSQKGIPNFWLTVFLNVEKLASIITVPDEEILKFLIDLRLVLMENPLGFKLEFEFLKNPFFANKILTKTYYMINEFDLDAPFNYEGPEINSCEGTVIEWLSEDKNVTKKVEEKYRSSRGALRKFKKVVDCKSFFNFFNPPEISKDLSDAKIQALQLRLNEDFEIGEMLRQAVVHEAVLCFTGEALIDNGGYSSSDGDETNDETSGEIEDY